MKIFIKSRDGSVVNTLNAMTPVYEDDLYQQITVNPTISDATARSFVSGAIYLVNEPLASSVVVSGYILEKHVQKLVTTKKSISFALSPTKCIILAIKAANDAGDKWLANAKPRYTVVQSDLIDDKTSGYASELLLDVCGNGYVEFKDKRTVNYKRFASADCVRNMVVKINHKYFYRQEMGLKVACAKAAKAQLEECGVTGLRILSYID